MIKTTKQNVESILTTIPYFIDTKSREHHLLWLSMLDIKDFLQKLITNHFLDESTIFTILTKINKILDSISELVARHIELKVIAYYSKLFIYLEDIFLENELYESLQNLKTFTNMYYNINIIK
jgi:hypothetical protein